MLLPSAFSSCDSSHSQPRLTRLQSALLASPPASPPHVSTQTAIGNIFTTCRSLQSLLAAPTLAPSPTVAETEPITPPTSRHSQLPTPPLAHAPFPMKLRLRSRKNNDGISSASATTEHGPIRKKRIVKRSAPPRGVNKRRRAQDDDLGRDDDDDDDDDEMGSEPETAGRDRENEVPTVAAKDAESLGAPRPQTPKRARIAPEIVPLGLERADYHALHNMDGGGVFHDDDGSKGAEGTDVVVEADGETWSTEEDRILVELVLEKLKLTKSDWQDCARSLGKDRGSVGRRWKSLMINGDIGLKRSSSRRGKLHGTWR
ncbi:hypothetical protein QBC46DRAFT_114838 [Diplogelasinospora grovesii]|uniref:Myb-like domain-containing protein n=1 Tax=Diplogelasinospora grovesii TaxID=303347 RepID=A0AAN6S9Z3_9PEZI|nr:hypothetical protein QBC46DRAFT_114838 [Diplogelasinospora grovesii]